MEPVQKIEVQDWMESPETRAVMSALDEGSKSPSVLFVGGCVRNCLLHKEVADIDIATLHKPEEVIKRLEAKDIKVIPTGIDHGTVTAVINKVPFEITTLRKDVETDGRRAVVAFAKDWKEDALRRDFTMNTLLLDGEGNLFDPTGLGLDDLQERRVVFVGEPSARIAEDYLRILRLFRFHAFYGQGEISDEALSACRAASDKISTLSTERITQEFFKIMSASQPSAILETMFDNNILNEVAELNYKPKVLAELCVAQDAFNLAFLPSRLFVLAGLSRGHIKKMQEILLFPKVFLRDIDAISNVLALGILDSDQLVKTAVYKFGRTALAQALLIQVAQKHIEVKYAGKPLELAISWDVPNFPVSGDDLIKRGVPPSPELGQKLNQIEDWWIDQGFTPDQHACLKQL